MANYERHAWLGKRVESAIDPQLQIIDPHHHLWDREGSTYCAAELVADTTAGHNVTHTVFVECSAEYDLLGPADLAPVGEVRFVREQAVETAAVSAGATQIAAIVGHANLLLGEAVEPVLHAQLNAGAGLFRGIRHGTNWSPYDDVKNGHHEPAQHQMSNPVFRAGLTKLAALGLSFDAWLYFDQLGELAELARAVPECTIVLDHLGGPLGIGPHASARDEMVTIWQQGMADVATCDNVVLKVGGLGMEHYFGTPWAELDRPPSSEEVAAHWADPVAFAIDSFGPDRCMFESNFPVDRQTLPYTVLWNAFQILADGFSADEKRALFAGTAARAYEIEL